MMQMVGITRMERVVTTPWNHEVLAQQMTTLLLSMHPAISSLQYHHSHHHHHHVRCGGLYSHGLRRAVRKGDRLWEAMRGLPRCGMLGMSGNVVPPWSAVRSTGGQSVGGSKRGRTHLHSFRPWGSLGSVFGLARLGDALWVRVVLVVLVAVLVAVMVVKDHHEWYYCWCCCHEYCLHHLYL